MKLAKRDFILFLIIIYFTFIGGTFYSQFNFFLRIANQVIVTGLLGVWLLFRLKKRAGLPVTVLDLALGLYLLANVISAGLGLSPRFSFEGLWFTIIHILAFYLLVDLIRRGGTARLTWAFFMASAVVCLVGLAEFTAWYFGSPLLANFSQGWGEIGGWRNPLPPEIYRLAITLNGPTPLSAYLALFIPVALGLIITLPRHSENRRALQIWLVLAVIVQILTLSRAGILALGTSLSLLFVGWLVATNKTPVDLLGRWRHLKPRSQRFIVLNGLASLAGLIFWLQRSFSGRVSSTNFRLTLWETALRIFQDQWLSGAGPGNFGRALLQFNEAALPRRQISTAHNIYLNTAAELGLPGLVAGGLLLAIIVWAWWQHWQQIPASDKTGRIRLVAVGAALAGLAAQTLVDTYMATPNMLLMLALGAYIVADVLPAPRSAWQPRLAAYVGLAVLLVFAAGFFWIGRADWHNQRSFWQQGQGNLKAAVAEAKAAQTFDPNFSLRTFQLALLEARLAHQTGDPALIQSALALYQTGLQSEPILGTNSANLAGLLWQQGQRAAAIDLMEQTITAEENVDYLINLGLFYETVENWSAATGAYGRALFLKPDLAGSGFWQATPERARRWPDLVEAALSFTPGDDGLAETTLLVKLALAQADFDQVQTLLADISLAKEDAFLRHALAQAYLHRQQPDAAQALLLPTPQAGQDYLLWGRVLVQQNNLAAAETLLKTAVFLGERRAHFYLGQLYEAQGDLARAEQAYQRGFSPRFTSENVEATIYGRLSGNDLAPQLLRIGPGPTQAASWLALARLYEAQGRIGEAQRVYQLLLAEDPFLEVAEARLAAIRAQ